MKCLIVDDEERVAQGILRIVKRLETPFDEVTAAYSGEEALKQMENFPTDLLLTDITMQSMSGLELIREAKERKLCENFCILSGYSEFEYARTALRLNVEEYLLKPVDREELQKVLDKVAYKIEERAKTQQVNLEDSLAKCFSGQCPEGAVPWPGKPPKLLVVTEMLFRRGRLISTEDFLPYRKQGLIGQAIQLQQLPAFVLLCDPERKQELLDRLENDFSELVSGTASGDMHRWSRLFTLYEKAVRAALTAHCFLDCSSLDETEIASSAQGKKAARNVLFEICFDILVPDPQGRKRYPCENRYIREILDLTGLRFHEDLTLEYLASHVGLTPDYAGRLFHSEMGMSFSEYLNRYRIQKILELMLYDPSRSFEQLAPEVGFPDVRNFYRVFKRIMGTTPGQYRNFLLHREQE